MVDLPGVGTNLQDRYEVGVVYKAKEDWSVLKGSKYAKGDPQYEEWKKTREGVYGTNGAVLAVIKRSFPHRLLPDLFCFAVLGEFTGYYPGYSVEIVTKHNYLTWAVLKAHTNNRSGVVTLNSIDPQERPKISFHYFEGDDRNQDVDSVVEGVKFVRGLAKPLIDLGLLAEETAPGPTVQDRCPASRLRQVPVLGPSRLVHLPDRQRRRSECGPRRRLQRAWNAGTESGRCLGVSEDTGVLHRQRGLHDRREGRRRDFEGLRQAAQRLETLRHDSCSVT